ncbi:hypothetical protein FB451DRAFT_1405862 [Mycena latifolia]|nr:hypothetical protein FB451DRAFT_1405862 [Mycena latifolia]
MDRWNTNLDPQAEESRLESEEGWERLIHGHISKLAEAVKRGIEQVGGAATIFRVAETLPQEVLTKMHAPANPAYPLITPDALAAHDAYLMGIPTRFGNFPAQ